jgi:hypothetical protein
MSKISTSFNFTEDLRRKLIRDFRKRIADYKNSLLLRKDQIEKYSEPLRTQIFNNYEALINNKILNYQQKIEMLNSLSCEETEETMFERIQAILNLR